MNLEQVIEQCARLGIELAVQDGQLEVYFDEDPPPELLAALKAQKSALLAWLSSSRDAVKTDPQLIHLDDDGGRSVCSSGQQRMWLMEQLQSGWQNNLFSVLEFSGEFDLDAARIAFELLLTRHEPLRTVYQAHDGEVFQQVLNAYRFELPLHDLRDQSAAQQEERLRELMLQESQSRFDLAADLMLRVCCVRTGNQQGVLLINVHHIAADGWSLKVLIDEFGQAYSAVRRAQMPQLMPMPVTYRDFARWQRQRLASESLAPSLAYWRRQLQGLPQTHSLPLDHPRSNQPSFAGARCSHSLDGAVVAALRQLAAENGVTLFMVLHAIFAVVLARYARESDIVLGVPVANRNHVGLAPMIGYLANTMVLRTPVSMAQPFSALLQQIKSCHADAQTHQDLPFEQLVEALNPPRSNAHTPLFQVMLTMNTAHRGSFVLDELILRPLAAPSVASKFDLTLNIVDSDSGIELQFDYACDLFEPTTIAWYARHFAVLAGEVCIMPDKPVGELRLADAEESAWLQSLLQGPSLAVPTATLDALLSQRAAAQPDKIAVCDCHGILTYGELERRAELLAEQLRQRGIGPEVVVGVCMERSQALPVALLATLKAGGAYLPIDPALPAARQTFMLADSRAALVLVDDVCQHLLKESPIPLLNPSQPSADLVAVPESRQRGADDLAYVMYTSGSTGTPKAVMVTQRNLVHFLTAVADLSGGTDAVWLASTPLSFDISALELFGPLLAGGKLVLAPESGARAQAFMHRLGTVAAKHASEQDSGACFSGLVERHAVTHFQCTPALLRLLLDEPAARSALATLRCLLVGGEACPPALARELRGTSAATLYNMYGPTEATVWSTSQLLTGEEAIVPIGLPLPHYGCHVVDEALRPVPFGVPGELLISGPGVARGYAGRADLTSERFIDFDAGGSTPVRAYRTGDLVRHLPDRTLEFLGRIDLQLKVRGFRIEPGEIEARLLECAGIREAVVLLSANEPRRLLAFHTVEQAGQPDAEVLRQALASTLPEYMIPAVFVELERIPLTANGKIDRHALLAQEVPLPTRASAPPAGVVEVALAEIWCELLKLDKVSREDHFFELGGHSLLTVQLMTRIRDVFQIELSLRALFDTPRLAQLAAAIEGLQRVQAEQRHRERHAQLRAQVASMSPAELEAAIAARRQTAQPSV
ncbi:amino acid adenylation domain-containing protein [Duganella sp. FT50W]|uniref:Amino acid adenylation domain-containing protein n=1 Tax=Duganella lactea TaxID=2692173 RepID=A0A6L8MSA5_9BURK|nr:non-ribosomal peptide synthetase [Duganella lactea]MYM84894.1 amino acid adenylation domain-containing protein [Duganella lactea]